MSLCRNVWELLCGVHSHNNSHHRKAQIKYSNLPKRHNKLRLLVTRALCSISSICGCCFSLQFFLLLVFLFSLLLDTNFILLASIMPFHFWWNFSNLPQEQKPYAILEVDRATCVCERNPPL